MFYINLTGVEFMACHGVLPFEKTTPQKFITDIRIETDQIITAAITDRIEDALNYVEIYEILRKIMLSEQYNLIETIAMKIATEIAQKYSVISVDVKVTKVNPPIEGYIGTVSCEYTAYGSE